MSRKALLLALAASLVCFSANAADKPKVDLKAYRAQGGMVSTITPVFSELVKISLPAGFERAEEKTTGNVHYIQQRVPAGETLERWSQMITLTGAKGLGAKPGLDPRAFANLIAGGFAKACPQTFAGGGLGAGRIGGHDGFIAWASCGTVNYGASTHAESAIIIAVKGMADYYTVQWAERLPASARPLAFDEAKWRARLAQLNPIRFCPRLPGEPPPYASCADAK